MSATRICPLYGEPMACAMALCAALGWHAGTALWRWLARRVGR